MKTFTQLLIILCAAAITGCSTVSVTTDYDKTADFGQYRTYAFASSDKGPSLSPSIEAALRETLRTEMARKGFAEATTGTPDIAVVKHAFTEDKTAVHEFTDGGYSPGIFWPYGYGRYSTWVAAPQTHLQISQYSSGTLILDFVDTKTNQLVFRGTGNAVLKGPETNARKIAEAVTRIVADFPERT